MQHCMKCGGALPLPNDRCHHCGRALSDAERSALRADSQRWWIVTAGLAVSSAFLALSLCSGNQ